MVKKATLCYIIDGDKTLMLYRNKKENDIHEGKYVGLGGKLEEGESFDDCVRREVYEESNIELEDFEKRGILYFSGLVGDDWEVHLYTSDKFKGNVEKHNREGDLEWILNKDIMSLNLQKADYEFMPLLYKEPKKYFFMKFEYTSSGELYDSEKKLFESLEELENYYKKLNF